MMGRVRWILISGVLGSLLATSGAVAADKPEAGARFLRFKAGDTTAYGILELSKSGCCSNGEPLHFRPSEGRVMPRIRRR